MNNDKPVLWVKLVTAKPRTLETKEDLSRPNAYTHDFADMRKITEELLRKK